MADMEEKLNQLLSDPASMQKVLNLASGILGAQKGQSPAAPAETDHAPPGAEGGGLDLSALLRSLGSPKEAAAGEGVSAPAEPVPAAPAGAGETESGLDLNGLLRSLGGAGQGQPENTGGENGGGLDLAALPKLMQAFSGDTNYLKPEKDNLLKALKPYFGDRRAPEIDRAVKMANLARAAQDTLGGFFRR